MCRLFVLLLILLATSSLASEEDAVLQRTVTSIIFQEGSPVITDPTRQQIKCTGDCSLPSKISCTNQGWDGTTFVWGCESLTHRRLVVKRFTVQCKRVDGEGEDVRILRNSCSFVATTSSNEALVPYAIGGFFVLLVLILLVGGPDGVMMFFICIIYSIGGRGGGGGGKSFGGSSYV